MWGYRGPTDVTHGTLSRLPADAPVLFRARADGDRDFTLTFPLTAAQAAARPLLLFDEPGLITHVTVNSTRVDRLPQGAWDGVSGGNTSAFLLDGVLKAGDNTVAFHPDFLRLRGLNYPVAAEVATPCGLPRLEFTGELQALVVDDPVLAPYLPHRLFKPGATHAVAPGARVLAHWNDGRPALVVQGNLLAWTSDITDQLHAAPVHTWETTWEASGHWDFNAADGTPRGDALAWENAAPLLAAALAQRLTPEAPRLTAVQPHAGARAVDLTLDNPRDLLHGTLHLRVLDAQGSIIADMAQPVQVAHGQTRVTVPVAASPFLGGAQSDTVTCYAGLRSDDDAVGWGYLERTLDLAPPVRVTVETDSLAARAIPDRLAYDPDFRGRHLWWPMLCEDPGSTVYLDGETAHVRITLTNTGAARTLPVRVELLAQNRGAVEARFADTVTLGAEGSAVLAFAHPLTGVCEPYLLRVTVGPPSAPLCIATRALYAVRPWKACHNVDTPPRPDGVSFVTYIPLSYTQQPDDVIPTDRYVIHRDPHNPGPFPELLDWWKATGTGTTGHGGGVSGYTGFTQGFGWGPFYRPTFNAPDQMSVLPNGQPVMHYLADGLRRLLLPPGRYTVADFWGNYWVPANWNTLAAFREWLANTAPARAAAFTPQTFDEAVAMVRDRYADDWSRWQAAVAIGGWGAVQHAAAPGSTFWCQAENAWIATEGVRNAPLGQAVDWRAVAGFLSDMFVAGDTDPATSRMGFGYRFRAYTENSAAALVRNLHCNVSTLRHVYFLNEQRMSNMGSATAETYRAHAYDTLWAAAVLPDGSLRSVVDTPPSEITDMPNSQWSGLKYGNRLFDVMYRLASVIAPEHACGLLWVAAVPRGQRAADPRAVYETLRNAGVPFSAMLGPDLLAVAPRTGAAGVVYLLPPTLAPDELAGLRALATAKYPVVCLLPAGADALRTQLPAGLTLLDWPADLTPARARALAAQINTAAHAPLAADPDTCLYAFRAQGRTFVVAQNLLATPRTATLTIRLTQKTPVAVDLNTNEKLPLAPTANGLTLPVPLDPWGATLVMVSGG